MHPAVMVTTVLGGLFMVALASVVFSSKAQTPQVFSAAGTALGTVLQAATAPLTGFNMTNLGGSVANSLGTALTNPMVLGQTG